MDASSGLAALGGSITSPAKIAFVAYVVLAYHKTIETSRWEFLTLAVVFITLQVIHDDYFRIVLNKCAELDAEKARRKAGLPAPRS
jgi:hypothetical protein